MSQVFEIIDKKTQDVVTRAPISIEKTQKIVKILSNYRYPITASCKLISGDFKHFFWKDGNERYTCKIIDDCQMSPIDYIERDDYTQVLWRSPLEKIFQADVIRDFSIDECDPEIQGLVYALNRIPGVRTVLSCCGHGKAPAWVTVACITLQGFYKLIDILKDSSRPHYRKFFIDPAHTSCYTKDMCDDPDPLDEMSRQFAIVTYECGEDAYTALKELEEHINELYEECHKEEKT